MERDGRCQCEYPDTTAGLVSADVWCLWQSDRPKKLTFMSQAGVDSGVAQELGLESGIAAVTNCRAIGKKDMIHNDATPKIEVDPETYEVRADGELLTCVSAGDKIPRKGGPGVSRSDLLIIINKIDLAPLVGADLDVMDRDSNIMLGDRPFCFTNLKDYSSLDYVVQWVQAGILSH
jgi:hypothetical protein